jgi:hypothetical protein
MGRVLALLSLLVLTGCATYAAITDSLRSTAEALDQQRSAIAELSRAYQEGHLTAEDYEELLLDTLDLTAAELRRAVTSIKDAAERDQSMVLEDWIALAASALLGGGAAGAGVAARTGRKVAAAEVARQKNTPA